VGYTKDTLQCPCGETIRGEDEDTLVENVRRHLERDHPDLVGVYSREDILFLAY